MTSPQWMTGRSCPAIGSAWATVWALTGEEMEKGDRSALHDSHHERQARSADPADDLPAACGREHEPCRLEAGAETLGDRLNAIVQG
jgi:hypothetical protein